MRTRLVILSLAALLAAGTLGAADSAVTLIPSQPTEAHIVMLDFFHPDILALEKFSRDGNHFRFDFHACRITCISGVRVTLGRLPAGTYTYSIFVEGRPLETGSFAVLPIPNAPALSPAALGALSALLAAAAWLVLARR